IASEAGIQAVLDYQDLFYTHRVAPTPNQSGGGRNGFVNGSVAMLIDGSWFPTTSWDNDVVEWSVGVFPVGRTASHPSTYVWGDAASMSSTSAHPEEAWLFLQELISYRWQVEER